MISRVSATPPELASTSRMTGTSRGTICMIFATCAAADADER